MKIVNYLKGIREIDPKLVYDEIRAGWFGLISKPRRDTTVKRFFFYSCRDGYQGVSKTRILRGGMFFSHAKEDGDRHALFLQRIEQVLKLEKKSKFRKTNRDDVLWIKVSPWWLVTKTRRSFLTLLLRMAKDYDPDLPWKQENVITVAKRHDEAACTLPAIRRFLKGNTIYPQERPRYHSHGWLFLFSKTNQVQVRKMLVKP